MDFTNVYEDSRRAESYARLGFPGTYYLAYRDIPEILKKYTLPPSPNGEGLVYDSTESKTRGGVRALDFGCGTGRSTRFLKTLGFDAAGADISADMIRKAREFDPEGNYVLTNESGLSSFSQGAFDLITGVFTFDNIPGTEHRIFLMKELAGLLNDKGVIILVDSTPEIYVNEWLSFSTKDFPENRKAGSGEKVKIIMTDVEDARPVEDIVWFDSDYIDLFEAARLKLVETLRPLGKSSEPYAWINETIIAPWVIYVLQK